MGSITGGILERFVFAEIKVFWKGYMKYRESMAWAINNQPDGWDPSDPPLREANDLHSRVALVIEEIRGEEFDWSELKLYTSLHTPLDYYHGVDGFFEFGGRVATIDVTMNPNKVDEMIDPERSYKANVILNYHYADEFPRETRKIAEMLLGA
jgi:hypothetical protein